MDSKQQILEEVVGLANEALDITEGVKKKAKK